MEAQTSRRHENRETRCPVSARTTRRYRLSVTTDKNAPPINFLARRESSEFLYRAGLAGMQRKTDDYRDQSIELALKGLDADRKRGLTSAEAAKRLARFGPNEIEEREEPLWHQLFRRFWGPIPWLIEIAAVLSALVQKWDDFIIILVMLLVNAGLDFMQEHRAHDALKVYITRSEGWFWQRPWPAPLLFWATFGTEILGTLIAVYGLIITPIGWTHALWAWAYALMWFLIDDAVKMWAYRMLRGDGIVCEESCVHSGRPSSKEVMLKIRRGWGQTTTRRASRSWTWSSS
jgi:hypothetical protein